MRYIQKKLILSTFFYMHDNKIHIINSEILPVLESLSTDFTEDIQSMFEDLKKNLSMYDIEYDELRSVLNPSAETWAFVFNADDLSRHIKCNYIDYLITKASKCLLSESKCVFLGGDLCVDKHNIKRYQIILKDNNVDTSLVFKTTLCAIVIINISPFYADIVRKTFLDESSFLFDSNITKPTIDKYALTCYLVQKNIKLGRKLLYKTPEPGDNCNYSGINFVDNEYKLCPIEECLYLVFLTARLLQLAAPFSEIRYCVKSFFDIEIKDYPKIIVAEEKIKYLEENKNIKLSSIQIEDAIKKAFLTNQLFHISYTGFGEANSLNVNVVSYIDDKKCLFSLKWDLHCNEAKIITALPR